MIAILLNFNLVFACGVTLSLETGDWRNFEGDLGNLNCTKQQDDYIYYNANKACDCVSQDKVFKYSPSYSKTKKQAAKKIQQSLAKHTLKQFEKSMYHLTHLMINLNQNMVMDNNQAADTGNKCSINRLDSLAKKCQSSSVATQGLIKDSDLKAIKEKVWHEAQSYLTFNIYSRVNGNPM